MSHHAGVKGGTATPGDALILTKLEEPPNGPAWM